MPSRCRSVNRKVPIDLDYQPNNLLYAALHTSKSLPCVCRFFLQYQYLRVIEVKTRTDIVQEEHPGTPD